MKTKIIILIYILVTEANAQKILWEKRYFSPSSTILSIDKTNDNGFIIVNNKSMSFSYIGTILKVNNQGDSIWARTLDSTFSMSYGNNIKTTKDGFVLACSKYVRDTTWVCIMKLNQKGDTIWTRINNLEKRNNSAPRLIIKTKNDSVYYTAGTTHNVGRADGIFDFVLKYGQNGKLICENVLNNPLNANELIDNWGGGSKETDTSFFLINSRSTSNPYDYFPHLFGVNSKGDTTLSKGYYKGLYAKGTSYDVMDLSYDETKKQLYWAGYFKDEVTGKIKLYLTGTNTNFDIGWTFFEHYSPAQYFVKIRILPNSNVLVLQSSSGGKVNLFTYNPQGERVDSAVIQSSFTSLGIRDVLVNDDSTITIAGTAQNLAYLAKIDIKKWLITGITEEPQAQNSFILSPNPSNGTIQIHSQQTGNMEIYDSKGLLLKKLKTESLEQQVDISDLKAGAYLYRFMMSDGVRYGKIVKE